MVGDVVEYSCVVVIRSLHVLMYVEYKGSAWVPAQLLRMRKFTCHFSTTW